MKKQNKQYYLSKLDFILANRFIIHKQICIQIHVINLQQFSTCKTRQCIYSQFRIRIRLYLSKMICKPFINNIISAYAMIISYYTFRCFYANTFINPFLALRSIQLQYSSNLNLAYSSSYFCTSIFCISTFITLSLMTPLCISIA